MTAAIGAASTLCPIEELPKTSEKSVELLPEGWHTEYVTRKSSSSKTGFFAEAEIIDNRDPANPIRMHFDLVSEISMKCFLVLIGLPFYTPIVMATHAIRCVTLLCSNLAKGEIKEAFLSVAQEVWSIVKAPFYAIAMAFWTLPGLFYPLPMRAKIAQLEAEWSGSERYYDLLRMHPKKALPAAPTVEAEKAMAAIELPSESEKTAEEKKVEECDSRIYEYFTDRKSKTTFFLAFCFQPIGALNDGKRVAAHGKLIPNC